MSVAGERLILGRGLEHATNTTTFQTSATSYSATNAARYSASGTTSATFNGVARFVEVSNDDATILVYATVGNSVVAPAAATAGATRIYPKTTVRFQLEQDGTGFVSCLAASGAPTGSIVWYR